MGTLGNLIRRIDYLRAKGKYEYKNGGDNPYELLEKFEKQGDTLNFNDLQDAWKAFEEKVCVTGYPERTSPPCKVAKQTADILVKRTKSLLTNQNEVRAPVSEILFHMLLSLIKAGPGSTHCDIMEAINCKALKPLLEDHVQTLDRNALISIMSLTKVTFGYTPNDHCTDERLGLSQRGQLVEFFLLFTSEQYSEIQLEFLDVYRHYHLQLPAVAQYEEYPKKISYLIDEMGQKFEKKNPYMHLQNLEILLQHLTIVKDLVCSDKFSKDGALKFAARRLLVRILKSKDLKDVVKDMFDHLMDILLEISKNATAVQQAGDIFYELQDCLFRKLDDAKIKVSFRNVDVVLRIITNLLLSGQGRPVDITEHLLNMLKKSKAVDWKNHVTEAKQMIEIVGEIPRDRLQNDSDSRLSSTFGEYKDFMGELLKQLQKSKVTPQLKETLVQFFFKCVLSDPELKAALGRDSINKEILDLSKEKGLRLQILQQVEEIVQNEDHPWDNMYFERAVKGILLLVVESYPDGGSVTKEENNILISIFKHVSDGGDSVLEQFYDEDNPTTSNWKLDIFLVGINDYMRVHMSSTNTYYIAPLMPNVLRWARIAYEENHKMMIHHTIGTFNFLNQAPPEQFSYLLPEVLDLMMATKKTMELFGFVSVMYPQNPKPVHDRVDDIFKMFDQCKEDAQRHLAYILNTVAQLHPEVFNKSHIGKMFERYKKGSDHEKYLVLMSLKAISEKFPKRLVEFFPQLCEDSVYKQDMTSVTLRCSTIACVGSVDKKLGEKAIDHLMKYVDHSDVTVAQIAVRELDAMAKPHQAYMQKYMPKLQKVEQTCTVPQLKDVIHEIILILEGKSVENIAEDVQQQQEDIEAIDEKVDMTIDTVIGIGDKVIEHDKEIGELETGLERVEERVDDVEEDFGETKVKVEEIDNKTISNAPKWSRDLTKLMNPEVENDWRLLASRLGYTNADIRGWATQHDPCMALLSEWYATHKTSEASYAVLTVLTEINRLDGAAIVENAMKQAEGVVEDEEFEYKSPPPVFISYQWGFQNEVKLLKHHLNMAGYECWMDVGQMGGGDKLFAKIDNGIRGAKIVICCVTEKYAQSPNCNREVNLSVNLNKPIIPLLMEKMDWPPKGSMGPIFSEYLFIRFFQRGGEETPDRDQRYWPIPKFQELLMQLNYFVVPDQKMVQKDYARWWAPIAEDIVIDKNRGKVQSSAQKPKQTSSQVVKKEESPSVFLSYQWGKQPQIKALYQRLTSLGYTVWMDIYQMGGGDSLYDKIDRGMRGCKAVVSCVTQKYSLSANCKREVSLADALKKPIIPLLLEQMKWPPDGPMSMVFTELLYINFYRDEAVQMIWVGEQFNELKAKLCQFVPEVAVSEDKIKGQQENQNKTMKVANIGKNKGAASDIQRESNSVRSQQSVGRTTKALTAAKDRDQTNLVKGVANESPRKSQNKIIKAVNADTDKQVAVSMEREEKSKTPQTTRERKTNTTDADKDKTIAIDIQSKDNNEKQRERVEKRVQQTEPPEKSSAKRTTSVIKTTDTNADMNKDIGKGTRKEPLQTDNKLSSNNQTPSKRITTMSRGVVPKAGSVNAFAKNNGADEDKDLRPTNNQTASKSSVNKSLKTGDNSSSSSIATNSEMVENKEIKENSTVLKKNSDQKTPKAVYPKQISNSDDKKKSSTCTVI